MSKFELGVPYMDASFVIRLPDEYDACDFAWFTIWCEDFNQTFTEVEIDPGLFVSLLLWNSYCSKKSTVCMWLLL